MTFTVTNQSNDGAFVANDGETILDAALRDNRIFPYGCRNGVCSACKCDLISGEVDYGEYEDFALSDAEKEAGKMLICQAVPLSDIVFVGDEIKTGASVQIKMLPCRVKRLARLADDVIALFLALPKNQEFNFITGQYIDIVLRDGQRRSFSISNLPKNVKQDGIELHIRLVSDGYFTPRVFSSMKEKDLLRFEGPFGTYFLQSEPQTPIIMIAGGTGFAPIKGLIEQSMIENPDQSIHFFWGARDQQDLYMDELARQWEIENPNFTYTPVLSECKTASWSGATGWVHEVVSATYENFENHDIYASGPPIMVDAVRDSLSQKGMKSDRFFFDSFDFAPQS